PDAAFAQSPGSGHVDRAIAFSANSVIDPSLFAAHTLRTARRPALSQPFNQALAADFTRVPDADALHYAADNLPLRGRTRSIC
ncbi:MAG: hypothetical protein J2P28_12850, partial [Actinobacteria bacterium]|nr:hypothetical protein [Actinomycetota bacterium]